MLVTHKFQSAVADSTVPGVVKASDWNDDHAVATLAWADIATTDMPAAVVAFQSSGYSTTGVGVANYINSGDSTLAATHPRFCRQSNDGRYWRLHLPDGIVPVDAVGALGDDGDDTDALIAISAYIADQGFGGVRFRMGGIYVAGKQTEDGGGYRYRGEDIVYGYNLDWFIIEGNGATLKTKAGLKFGGFDNTDTPTVAANNFDIAESANIGVMLRAEGCGKVKFSNLLLDGNCAAAEIGGPWGDSTTTGQQCIHYGHFIAECDNVEVDNVHAVDFLCDGGSYRWFGLAEGDPIKPALYTGCSSKRSGRNCFSQVGGNGFLAVGCDFADPGYAANAGAPGGFVSSGPASGFDVEAESAVIRDTVFNGCTFSQGAHGSSPWTAPSGDIIGVTLRDCTLDGYAWAEVPHVLFDGCTIHGGFTTVYGGEGATVIRNCRGDDIPRLGAALPGVGANFINTQVIGGGVWLEGNNFTLAHSVLMLREVTGRDCRFTIRLGTGTVADHGVAAYFDTAGTDIENFVFIDETGEDASDPYASTEGLLIATDNGNTNSRIRNCRIIPTADYTLKWNSWAGGGGGYPRAGRTEGRFDNGTSEAFQQLRFQREANFGGGENQWNSVSYRSAAPASGTWAVGDTVFNTAPTAGGFVGWVCTVAGTPGTWKTFGAISA